MVHCPSWLSYVQRCWGYSLSTYIHYCTLQSWIRSTKTNSLTCNTLWMSSISSYLAMQARSWMYAATYQLSNCTSDGFPFFCFLREESSLITSSYRAKQASRSSQLRERAIFVCTKVHHHVSCTVSCINTREIGTWRTGACTRGAMTYVHLQHTSPS